MLAHLGWSAVSALRVGSVALNALFYDPGVSGGTETYLRGLVPALATERPDLRVRVYTTGRGASALRADGWGEFAEVVALRSEEGQRLRRLGGEQLAIPAYARREGCDVIHSLGNTGPLWSGPAHVLTVLDVTFVTTDTLPRSSSLIFKHLTASAARRADGLIAISAAARDEICRVLGLDRERFSVVPLGAGRSAPDPLPEREVRAQFGLPGDARVVLCVAALRPHKNQEALVRALGRLPEDVVVVLAGHGEGYEAKVRALAEDLGVTGRVRLPGYIPDAALEGLWNLAACAALPTRAEGFGLPVVEAMRRGLPVACSDIPVLHEVGGDVPEYFDASDPAAVAAAVQRALDSERGERGVERAARFTWAETARATLDAYERALAR
jgi:glycosyltransferase involved in cell wall biosynthesis